MKWISHQIVTGAVIYLATDSLLLTACGMAGAVIPDRLEGDPRRAGDYWLWRRLHRGLSHWPAPYLFVIALLLSLRPAVPFSAEEPVMVPVAVMAVVLRLRMPMPAVGLMVGVRRRLMRLVLLWLVRLGWVWRGLVLLMLLVVERMPAGWVARPRIRIPVGLMVRGPGPTRARMALVAATRLDGPATTAAPRAVSRRTPVPRARGPMSPGLRMRLRRTIRLILVLLVIPLLPLMPTGTDLTMTRCTTTITETVETMTIPIMTSRAPMTAVRPTVTRPFPSCSKTAPAT